MHANNAYFRAYFGLFGAPGIGLDPLGFGSRLMGGTISTFSAPRSGADSGGGRSSGRWRGYFGPVPKDVGKFLGPQKTT